MTVAHPNSPFLTGRASGSEYVADATHGAQRQRLRKTAADLAAETMDQNVQPMGIEIPGLIGQRGAPSLRATRFSAAWNFGPW